MRSAEQADHPFPASTHPHPCKLELGTYRTPPRLLVRAWSKRFSKNPLFLQSPPREAEAERFCAGGC